MKHPLLMYLKSIVPNKINKNATSFQTQAGIPLIFRLLQTNILIKFILKNVKKMSCLIGSNTRETYCRDLMHFFEDILLYAYNIMFDNQKCYKCIHMYIYFSNDISFLSTRECVKMYGR